MGGWVQDLRFAARTAVRNPVQSAAVVATLALGIGAATAIFSVVDATLLRPLPFEDAGRLVFLQGYAQTAEGPRIRGGSYPEIVDWKRMSTSFTDVSILDGVPLTLEGGGRGVPGSGAGGEAERIRGEVVSAGYFDLLGVDPIRGRTFTGAEDAPPGAAVVVIGEDLWERRFGRDPGIVGATVRLNRMPYTVIGVLPASFGGMDFVSEAWVPAGEMFDLGTAGGGPDDRGSRWLGAVGRLAPGVSLDAARADLDRVAASLTEEHPDYNTDRGVQLDPVREVLLGDTRTLVLVLLGAVGLLLLIAGANVTNLLLVRASARRREVLMRRALGAARGRLVRQFLTESAVLAGAGTALGVLLAYWGVQGLMAVVPDRVFPGFVEAGIDLRVLLFAVGLLALTGALSGLAPAWGGSRAELADGLKESARGAVEGRGGGGGGISPRRVLVTAEVAVALVLLVGAGLMMRSFRNQLGVDPGFEADRVLAFRLGLPEAAYDREEVVPFVRELVRELEAIPGVERAVAASDLPLRGIASSAIFSYLPGRTDREDAIRVYFHRVQPDYFETLGIPITRGRAFLPEENTEGVDVVILGDAYARRHFPDRDPVGETVLLGPNSRFTVVGVTGPVRIRDLTSDIGAGDDDPDLYLPYGRAPARDFAVAVRAGTSEPAALLPEVRRAVARLDASLPVARAAPLSTGIRNQTAQARFGTFLLGTFSVLALILAAVGIYGVMAVSVGRRSREIAIRMAMGADARWVRGMVVGQGMKLVVAGLALGVVGAALLSRALSALLYGVGEVDPATYAAVAGLLGAVGLLATWIPARRATTVDPQRTLAAE